VNIVNALTETVDNKLEAVLGFLGNNQWDKYWGWGGCAEFAFGLTLWLRKQGIKAEVVADKGEHHFAVKAQFKKTVYLDSGGIAHGVFPTKFGLHWLNKADEFAKRYNIRLNPSIVQQLVDGEDPEPPDDWKDPHADD
jgi:hypothetical protein